MRTINKILCLLAVLLWSLSSVGQAPKPAGFPSPYSTNWYRVGYLQADSGMIDAPADTTIRPRFMGYRIIWAHAGVDTSEWFYTGIKWVRLFRQGDPSPSADSTVFATKYDVDTAKGNLRASINQKIGLTNLSASGPLVYNNATGAFSCPTCAVGSTGISSLNGLTASTQTFAFDHIGTNLGVTSSGSTHTFHAPIVNGSDTGVVTPTLLAYWNAKQNAITTGSSTQYLRGDLSLATFPTRLGQFSNDVGYITGNQPINFTATGDVTGTYTNPTSLNPTLTIGNNKVTYAKIQAASGQALLGATAAGNYQEIGIGSGLAIISGVLTNTGGGGGGGNTNSNVGSGFRWAIPNTNNVKTFFCIGCTLDSTTNTNALTLTVTGGGSGTVTSVAQTVPSSLLTISGSPVTVSGTLAIGLANAGANTVWGNNSGSSGTPAYFSPTATTLNGWFGTTIQSSLSNSGSGFRWFVPGSSIRSFVCSGCTLDSTTNAGSLTLTVTAGGSGTVTSVAQTVPSSLLTIAGSPITTNGTLAIGLANAGANTVWGNNTGSTGAPVYFSPTATILNGWFGGTIQPLLSNSGSGFRWFVPGSSIRSFVCSGCTLDSTSNAGSLTLTVTAGGSGTVTSVSASVPSSLLTISGSPITTSGTLAIGLANFSAHTYFGNNTGSSTTPIQVTNTQLTADLNLFTNTLQGVVPASGGGTINFLRADGAWASPLGLNNADSIRHLFVDSIGMRNTWTPFYNVNTNTFQFSQPNNREGYLGVLYAKKNPPTSDFTVFGSATIGTATNGKMYITGGSGFGSGARLTAYGITRLTRWKFFVRVIDSVNGFGEGGGIYSTNGYTTSFLQDRMDLSAAAGCQSYIYSGQNISSPTTIATSGTSTNPTAGDTVDITVELKEDTVYFTGYNRTKNVVQVLSYGFNLYNPGPLLPNTGNFSLFHFGGTNYIDSIYITSTEVKNGQLLMANDSKFTDYLDSLRSLGMTAQLNQFYPTTVNHSRGNDRSTEIISDTAELWALSPKQILLAPVSNDLRSGMSQATSTANFLILYNACIRHGIKVVLATPFYETSVDQSSQVTMEVTNFPNQPKIDLFSIGKSNPSRFLASDNIHPNRYYVDSAVKQTILQNIVEGGLNLASNVILNPQLAQNGFINVSGNINSGGNITALGAVFAGNTSVASGGALFDGQVSSTLRFRVFNGTGSIGIGAFTNNLGSSEIFDIYGPITFDRQEAFVKAEIARIDTTTTTSGRVGTFLVGRISPGSTDAPIQAKSPGQYGLSMETSGSSGIAMEFRTPTGVNYAGSGLFATGGAANDFSIRAQTTGKILFAGGTGGTFYADFDNGTFNLGSITSVASSILTVTTTTQGSIPMPSQTTTQKNAISSPAEGLMVYDNVLHTPYFWNGSAWTSFGGSGAVSSVSNSDGTLTISPTTGAVVASLALGHTNTWTGKQTQPAPIFTGTTSAGTNDSTLTIDPATGQVHWRSGTTNIVAANGIQPGVALDSLILGGTLNQNTFINAGASNFNLTLGSTNSLGTMTTNFVTSETHATTAGNIIYTGAGLAQSQFTASNANLTLTPGTTNGMVIVLGTITANRTVTLSSPNTGQTYEFDNQNGVSLGSSFKWTFATTVFDPVANVTITNIPLGRSKIYYNGSGWVLVQYPSATGYTNQTSLSNAGTTIVSVPTRGYDATYRIEAYVTVTAISVDQLTVTVTYTDETGTSRTITIAPVGATAGTISTTGVYAFNYMIRVQSGSVITLSTNLTVNTGTITYDAGGNISLLNL